MSNKSPVERLIELLKTNKNLEACLWFGQAPCPKCKEDHGDPHCSEEDDAMYRALYAVNVKVASAIKALESIVSLAFVANADKEIALIAETTLKELKT